MVLWIVCQLDPIAKSHGLTSSVCFHGTLTDAEVHQRAGEKAISLSGVLADLVLLGSRGLNMNTIAQ